MTDCQPHVKIPYWDFLVGCCLLLIQRNSFCSYPCLDIYAWGSDFEAVIGNYLAQLTCKCKGEGKGKAILLQAWTGP